MPSIEMPLAQLKQYLGTNPRPADFDAYWERGLKQLDQTPPACQIVPSDFEHPTVACNELYFTGVGGARLHAKLLIPKQVAGRLPAVLQFHGYTGHAGNWSEKLAYAAAGFVVAALDCRGQAGLSQDMGGALAHTVHGHVVRGILEESPDRMLMRDIFLDTVQLTRVVMGMVEVDENRIGVMGGSQGGGLALACAALESRIRCVAADYPFLSDYQRAWELNLTEGAYAELKTHFRDRDPLHQRETAFFSRLGYIDVHHLASRIQGCLLMAITLMDDVCPPSTQFAVFNNATGEKQLCLYPDYTHEAIPSHADIVYHFMIKNLMG